MTRAATGTARHRLHISRWRAAALLAILVFATTACGGDDDSASESENVASTDELSSPTTGTESRTTEPDTSATSTATEADASSSITGATERLTVTINTFNFQPDPLTVVAGTLITFVNEDAIDHTVTAGTREAPQPELFDGVLPEEGTTFELTLGEAGVYDYFCRRHSGPGMTGTIIVE